MDESSKKPKKSKEERTIELQRRDGFAKNAFILFNAATKIVSDKALGIDPQLKKNFLSEAEQILNKMLHSILFLGNIHAATYLPESILSDPSDVAIFNRTLEYFPEAFKSFQTHVTLRTPFSYFLELVTLCYGQGDELTVMRILSELLSHCKKSGDLYPLISTVICICENNNLRYYGVSLSCEGDREREIMTAVSCLHVWHRKVSSAVMSVFPEDNGNPRRITLPGTVSCRAYAVECLSQKQPLEKPPCRRCHELYSLPGHSEHLNTPGNCAETEAISNLLKSHNDVDLQTIIAVGVYNNDEIMKTMSACFNENMTEIYKKKNSKNNYNILNVYK